MFLKSCAVVIFAFLAFANQVHAQDDCVAESVTNLTLDANHILSWDVREDEVCQITQFLVYIYERDRPIEYSFEVDDPWVDVSFLKVCHEWIFNVVPVSEHTRGREHRLFSSIPLPADANLTIDYINVTRNGVTGDLQLSWDFADTSLGSCSLRFRLTIEEETDPEIQDLYLSERSINLHFLSPCTLYQFGVRAINIALPTIEGPEKKRLAKIPPAPQIAPHLDSIDQFVYSFNTTWSLQQVTRNRCPLVEFRVAVNLQGTTSVYFDEDSSRAPMDLSFDGLKPNSMYYLRAYTQNSAGWSPPTVVAIQTLDYSPDKDDSK